MDLFRLNKDPGPKPIYILITVPNRGGSGLDPLYAQVQIENAPRRRHRRIRYTPHDRQRWAYPEEPVPGERSEFERDRSRIIHSSAFRRLQGKTQVFMSGEGDFLRTRLTHSLEVAQIGKGLALRLGADPDLVEAISLLHDIGHPPFGHAGEDELKVLMKPHGGFEANAQNLRIINCIEIKSEDYHGLNLTRAVIDGQLKYKNLYDDCKGKFVYIDDEKLVKWASLDAMTAVHEWDVDTQSFECQIMDWADDVAYAVHDLEDGIHTGYIDASVFHDNPRNEEAIDEVSVKFRGKPVDVRRVYSELMSKIRSEFFVIENFRLTGDYINQKASRKRLTGTLIRKYISGTRRIRYCDDTSKLVSQRYCYGVHKPIVHEVEVALINRLIMKHVIESPRLKILEEKGKHIVHCIFEKMMTGENARALMPEDWKDRLPDDHDEDFVRKKARVICDYVGGMTDAYAQGTFAKLFLPNSGSIYDAM